MLEDDLQRVYNVAERVHACYLFSWNCCLWGTRDGSWSSHSHKRKHEENEMDYRKAGSRGRQSIHRFYYYSLAASFHFLGLCPPLLCLKRICLKFFFGRWKARRSWTGSNVPTTSRIHVGSVHSLRTAEINNSYQRSSRGRGVFTLHS